MLYKQYGGNSLVDATSLGIGRDPVGLARISRATGLNVIMGGSYYVDRAHPPDMDDRSEDDLVEQIVGDITEGVDETGIKTGVIGEVGCSWPLTNNERKVLRASGRAQRITGAPILIHPGFDDQAPLEIIEVLRDAGANLGQTIIGHIDAVVSQLDILKQVAESGCYIEWDLIGKEESHFKRFTPNDNTRMDYIAWLSSQGYGDKILVAQDICDKNRLFKYGGHGYFFILANIVPRMRARGFSQDAINKILVENPKAALTFVEPKRE
jgi:phosphotriesterase-related protein